MYVGRSRLTHEQTRYIFETNTIGIAQGEAVNVDDIIAWLDEVWDRLKVGTALRLIRGLTKESYFKAVDEYCIFVERFVPKREKKIIEKLKTILNSENNVFEAFT